jgi:hypothetical protein
MSTEQWIIILDGAHGRGAGKTAYKLSFRRDVESGELARASAMPWSVDK